MATTTVPTSKPSQLNQPLDKPLVKFHLTSPIIQALKYLDSHQNDLSKSSQLISDKLLNIIDQFPQQFIHLDDSDDELTEIISSNKSIPATNPDQLSTKCVSSNPESISSSQLISTKDLKIKGEKKPILLPPLLHSLPTDEEINKQMLHQHQYVACTGCIEMPALQSLQALLIELKYPLSSKLYKLLENTTVCTHEQAKSNYTQEFAAHLQLLRERQQRQEFEQVMANLPSRSNPRQKVQSESDRGMMKKSMQMVGLPLNMIAVAGTISFIFYWIAKTINLHNRLFHWSAAIVGLLLGFIVEVLLFVIRDFNDTKYVKHKTIETEKAEKKQFLNIIRGNIMHGRIPMSGLSKLPTFNAHDGDIKSIGPDLPQGLANSKSDEKKPLNDKQQPNKHANESKKQR